MRSHTRNTTCTGAAAVPTAPPAATDRLATRLATRTATTRLALTAAVAAIALLSACRPVTVEGRAGSPAPSVPQAPAHTHQHTAPPSAPATSAAPSRRTPAPSPTKAKPALLMGRGAQSGQVRELQARLRALSFFGRSPTGYYGDVTAAAVGAFQGAHGLPRTGGTDVTTWQRLLALTSAPTRDELYPPTTLPITKPDPRCMTGRVLCISKKSRSLSWMVGGRRLSAMDVRFGSEYTPTREGAFTVFRKSRHQVSTIYHTPMPYAMFFSGGQAVHYSSDFAARGYAGASHGCVNVRDEKKIAALFNQVRTGDKVVVY